MSDQVEKEACHKKDFLPGGFSNSEQDGGGNMGRTKDGKWGKQGSAKKEKPSRSMRMTFDSREQIGVTLNRGNKNLKRPKHEVAFGKRSYKGIVGHVQTGNQPTGMSQGRRGTRKKKKTRHGGGTSC